MNQPHNKYKEFTLTGHDLTHIHMLIAQGIILGVLLGVFRAFNMFPKGKKQPGYNN